MQTQQNSYLHEAFLQVMWLQQRFFSIEFVHLGHGFVLANSQLYLLEEGEGGGTH
jgi:hypothetical protein